MGSGEKYNFGKTNYIKNKETIINQIVQEKYNSNKNQNYNIFNKNNVEVYRQKSKLSIPKNAKAIIQEKNGYSQIKYIWSNKDKIYEARIHTPTPNSGENVPTWQYSRITKGVGAGKNARPKKEFILTISQAGRKKWIPKSVWQEILAAKKRGSLTENQRRILNEGHIKF